MHIGILLALGVLGAALHAQQATPPPNPPPAPAGATPPSAIPAAPAPASDGYVAYAEHDMLKMLGTRTDEEGHEQHFLDVQFVGSVYEDLALHAQNYPPTFRSDAERVRATRDADILSRTLDEVLKDGDPPDQVLLLAARAHALAHNLDVREAGARASRTFERILAKDPKNAQAHFHYGAFLAASGSRPDDALAHLKQATELGVDDAWYALGMHYLALGDREKAISCFETYTQRRPADQSARKMLEGLKSGKIKVNVSNTKR